MVKVKTKITPVRYPGGKSNALKFLEPHFKRGFQEYREPFFGGGSVGLYLMQTEKDAVYWINDLFYPVYCFWKTLYDNPHGMVQFLTEMKANYTVKGDVVVKGTPSKSSENGKGLHTFCRQQLVSLDKNPDLFETACYWYILNKTSYSGMAMIGSYAPLAWDQNFTDNCITNLPKTSELMHSVKDVKITNLDYAEMLKKDTDNNTFVFLDPPYKIVHNLYGKDGNMHEGFNHQKFCNDVKECPYDWMITYNEDSDLIAWLKDYKQVLWDLQYTMKAAKRVQSDGTTATVKSGKKGKELLVMNYGDDASKIPSSDANCVDCAQ